MKKKPLPTLPSDLEALRLAAGMQVAASMSNPDRRIIHMTVPDSFTNGLLDYAPGHTLCALPLKKRDSDAYEDQDKRIIVVDNPGDFPPARTVPKFCPYCIDELRALQAMVEGSD